jgi:hypothetical protein
VVAVQIGLDLLTTATAATTSAAGEEMMAVKNQKVGSFSFIYIYACFFSEDLLPYVFGHFLIGSCIPMCR